MFNIGAYELVEGHFDSVQGGVSHIAGTRGYDSEVAVAEADIRNRDAMVDLPESVTDWFLAPNKRNFLFYVTEVTDEWRDVPEYKSTVDEEGNVHDEVVIHSEVERVTTRTPYVVSFEEKE